MSKVLLRPEGFALSKPPGAHRQAVRRDAESDRLRHPGRRHDHRSAAQQPQTAGEAHHQDRGGDLRQPGPKEPGAQVPMTEGGFSQSANVYRIDPFRV